MLQRIGGFMFFAGVASSILYFMDYELRILSWLNEMEPAQSWAIRIGLLVVGGVLFLVGRSRD